MAVLSLTQAQLAYGHVPLLDNAGLALDVGERLGLIGRNGAGKSSLLKIIAGLELLDDGLLQLTQGLRICYVAQEPTLDPDQDIFTAVSQGVAQAKALRERYESGDSALDLDALQSQIEALDAWNWEQRVQTTLDRLHLDGQRQIGSLSGGLKKRVALAQALVAIPDVLLLDEPTNHLDLEAIAWLESLLCSFKGSIILITHDRDFLDAVATRIIELDRGLLRSYPGNFSAYEAGKEAQLAAEALSNARTDKLLAQEEVWIRKGVEARRTRSVARIHRLEALRAQRLERRQSMGQVRLDVDASVRSGKLVAQLENVTLRWGEQSEPVVHGFNATLLRGDKVGFVGPNGAGKTTLLKLILGELSPSSGTVRLGSKMQVAYFDQMRSTLNLDATLVQAISPGSEWIEIGSQRKHVMSYLGDFLFSPERANSPVRTLSGGERNRVLLARLFALPANLLVLDEPTNDLDIQTLELLEDLLQAYTGTVFLVSHDRRFLDNCVTSLIAWEGDQAPGLWREYEGGYQDLKQQRARNARAGVSAGVPKISSKSTLTTSLPPIQNTHNAANSTARPKAKLSFKEQRELDQLPERIAVLEQEQAALLTLLADGKAFNSNAVQARETLARQEQISELLSQLIQRWEALESKQTDA